MTRAVLVKQGEIVGHDDLAALPTEDLRRLLAETLTLTAQNLMRAAAIWTELHRRDEPVPALRSGIGPWLPHIARGQLAAEAVIAFADRRMLLNRMISMPLDQQRRLAAGEEISVAAINDRGEVIGERKSLGRLSSREILLAVDNGAVRELKTQIKTLAHMITRSKSGARARSGYSIATIRADLATGTLAVGRAKVRPSDLADALRDLGYLLVRQENE